ncbi:hypothetical protein HDU86_007525 [Geranomyces michiganensis]|nr:hypothetical protein HDU86_007525 [Geranomyces michiganensis]
MPDTTAHAHILHTIGCVSGFSAVALGAFGAHALGNRLTGVSDAATKLANWRTAATYHLVHTLAILYVAGRVDRQPVAASNAVVQRASLPGYLFGLGNLLFSGSIYLLVLDTRRAYSRILGPTTPLGGLAYLAGWAALYWS